MILKRIAPVVAVILLAAVTASCARAPEARIMASCTKEEGNTRETCACFVDGLKDTLTAEEMDAFADAIEASGMEGDEAQTRMQERLGFDGMMKVMSAAKNCSLN